MSKQDKKGKDCESDLIDIHSHKSKKKGFAGQAEMLMRKHINLAFALICFFLVFLYCFCIGTSFLPGYFLYKVTNYFTADFPILARYFFICMSLGFGALCFIFTMILVVPFVNWALRIKVKPLRGNWYSLETIPWFIHNALAQLVRYTVLEFIVPTPLAIMYFRLMGMKIGKGVIINSANIVDPCLITLEDYVTIGGSASILAHYGQKGILIISEVHIGRGSTIGLKACILGDVIIGENVVIPPGKIILPKTRIKDHEKVA